ncbi:2-oxoglutarate dehydrogenase complex dihydrolipoyllysine-residue succinyltransferase [Paludisphaera borealis]|uniref:Dihydrolipoyllysine-residue succinyltransferase component of 2-oxoglutarate dehydrogenase complex n=1 Tax=Paludisphaera borealis TaxID=1387353 RepID=A0A1U7CV87_9BACT|nr:2-oxoglutarate dehydrogenase complex dihydrolipoyllysine-residue succinyltransferase [Paludisphaera borealis]APW62860.1 Dihydrolipoyllysine-residue succinyltransferase component of 2-oxoglutarate dehydrogenase complex [Paludisphaera borealis]
MSAVSISVPGVGESISEGILSRWLVADGSQVKAGDPLFELETDKATNIVPAPASGVLKVGAAEGDVVAIGANIGTIDPSGAPASAAKAVVLAESAAAKPAAANAAGGSTATLAPSVRRIVAEEGVDASQVAGTGRDGRITKGDVLGHLEQGAATKPAQAAPAAPPAPVAKPAAPVAPGRGERETRQRMSGLRQRIAQRLVEVQQTAAILSTFNEVDMSRVMDLRAKYKDKYQKTHGVSLGFMSFFVKATIEAIKAFPAVNARIEGNEIVYQNYFNIGVAVSTERGLMVPVLRDADTLSFAGIEKAIGEFADKARKGTIGVDDLQGGTFTITNGGVFGSLLSTPILNPPQSGILGMHAIKKRPVVVDDQIVIRPMMYLALSYDHRLIDGREAVSALVRIKDCLEDPERMLLSI